MGEIEDALIQASNDLAAKGVPSRVDYLSLYNTTDGRINELFSTLHYHYNRLFGLMNNRLPTKDGTAHFWADPSRELLTIIDITNLIYHAFKNSLHKFSIENSYNIIIDKCSSFLKNSGGSSIPPNTDRIALISTQPIFELAMVHRVDDKYDARSYMKKLIGIGSYAHVYRYRDEYYQEDFVIKTANKDLSAQEKERFRREYETMKSLSSPYIVKVYNYIEKDHSFIMESMDCTLDAYVRTNNNKPSFDVSARRRLCNQVFRAFDYIHSKNIFHRDISPTNILIKEYDDVSVIKISDMGLVKLADSKLTNAHTEFKGYCNDPSLQHSGFANYALPHEIYALTRVIKYIMSGSTHIDDIKNEELRNFVHKGTEINISARFSSVKAMANYFNACNFTGQVVK